MKMGNIVSPWRYDVAAAEAIRPDNLRRTTILRYASSAAVFRMSRVARLPFDGSSHFDQSRVRPDGPFQASQSHSRNWIWTMVIVIGRSPNGRSGLGNHFGVVQWWLLAGDPMPAFLSGPGPRPTPTPAR
jgi:hypothetical protein